MRIERDPELQRRGIASAAAAMQWGYSGDYWRYPVYDLSGVNVGYRLKLRQPDAQRAKYLWEGGKPANPATDYYHAPDIAAAIARAQGIVYLANGEPSVLAYHAAGIRNVIATTHTEQRVPPDMLAVLRDLCVTRVIYPHDNDATGRQSAAKFRDSLASSGIDYEALDLSGVVGAKGDFNDVLMAHGPERARAMLDELPTSELPAPQEAPPAPARRGDSAEQGQIDYDQLNAALSAYFSRLPGWKRSGKGWAGPHPFRKDSHPSAGYTPEHGGMFTDFADGSHIEKTELAEICGIPSATYRRPMPARSSHNAGKLVFTGVKQPASDGPKSTAVITIVDKPAPRSWWTTAAIPHSHLAALLLTCDVAVTRLVQAMHAGLLAGAIVGEGFIMADVLAISPIDRRATYRAVEKLQTIGLVTKLGIEGEETTIPKNVTSYAICAPDALRWTLIQRGIYPALFKRYFAGSLPDTLPPALFGDDELPEDATLTPARLRQLAAAYGELATDADRATQSKFKSELRAWQAWLSDSKPLRFEVADNADKTTYRAAILRAVLANADPDAPHARRDLARLCGCSENTLDTLYKALNIIPVPQWELVPLQAGDSASIRAQYVKAQKSKRGKVMNIVIEDSTTTPDDFESIERAHLRGAPVYAQLRVASKLRPMTDAERQQASAQPVEAEPDRTVEPERTEDKPVITLFERWLRIALSRMGYSMNQHRDIIARNGDTAAYEVDTNALIDFVLNGRRLERTA